MNTASALRRSLSIPSPWTISSPSPVVARRHWQTWHVPVTTATRASSMPLLWPIQKRERWCHSSTHAPTTGGSTSHGARTCLGSSPEPRLVVRLRLGSSSTAKVRSISVALYCRLARPIRPSKRSPSSKSSQPHGFLLRVFSLPQKPCTISYLGIGQTLGSLQSEKPCCFVTEAPCRFVVHPGKPVGRDRS